MFVLKSLVLFVISGLCEIGGGYLVWLCIKENRPWWYGALGGLILVIYGVVASFQNMTFARAYATYGGIFIFMSIIWAMKFDHFHPDIFDIVGACIALLGVSIICFYPRH